MTIRVSEASVTRPANTTTYTAGDVVGDPAAGAGEALEFFSDQSGIVRNALLVDSAAETTKPDIDLLLFDAKPTIAADNAAFAVTDAQMERLVGVVSFAGSSFKTGASGNGAIQVTGLDIAYSANKKLYGVLVARNAYIPISAEKFTVRLSILIE